MASDGYVAVMIIELHFPQAGSLKAKRKELSSLKAQLRTRLGVAVSETAHQDTWQRGQLTGALTGGDLHVLSGAVDEVERFVLARCPDGAQVERLVASIEDLRG